jgi:hypothetical protein
MSVTNLPEIEKAAEALSVEEKQRLIRFLAVRVRAEGVQMPEARKFSREQVQEWIEEDEKGNE